MKIYEDVTLSAEERAQALVSEMTVEECTAAVIALAKRAAGGVLSV